MSVDFRPTLPGQTVEADVEAPTSAGHDAGASSFAGRLQGILSPVASAPTQSAAERLRRRSTTPVVGIERFGRATRSVPHVDVAHVAAVPLPANVAFAPRFEGAAQLLGPLAQLPQLGATMEGDDRAPPRERPHQPTAASESSAADGEDPPCDRPSRAHLADAGATGQALPVAPRHESPADQKLPAPARGSEPPPRSPVGPAPQAVAARLAKAVAAGVASLTKAATHVAAPVAGATPAPAPETAKPPPAAASAATPAAPAPAISRAPASGAAAPPSAKVAPPSKASPVAPGAAEAAVPITPGAAEPQPNVAAAAPATAKPKAYLPPAEPPAMPLPDVHWKKGDAHLSVKTDAGDLSLHVRVKDGTTEVAAAGPAAKHLGAAGAHLQAQLAKEGLVLGRFATQTTAHVASLDDPLDPFARQDPDEDDGTASAEGDDQRLISGKGRSRSLRRMHVKA